jgi:hypothetical protein
MGTMSLADLVQLFHDYDSTVTAVATVFIAIFTVVLGLFTISVAKSTRIAAEAAIAVERPRLHVSRLFFNRLGGDIRDREKMPEIEIGFKNIGRTAAFITDVRCQMTITRRLPRRPKYGDKRIYVPTGFHIVPDQEWILERQLFAEFNPTKENSPDLALLSPFRTTFWAYGYVAYLDHLGKPHRHGFVAWWVPPDVHSVLGDTSGKNFIRANIKHYTYDT